MSTLVKPYDWFGYFHIYGDAGTYALVITGRQRVGSYHGSPVFLVTSMKFLCCNSTLKLSNSQEVTAALPYC